MQKLATTQAGINEVIATRRSARAFDANKPVTQEQIISLVEAARWAPSCYGDEPWRFVVWDKNKDATAWQQALDCIMPGNQTWAGSAPVFVLVCAGTIFGHNEKDNRWGAYDTGAAAVSLCLQATALSLVTHQMGGFDGEKVRALCGVPEQFQTMAMIAVGHEGDADNLPEDLKAREDAPRKRSPLGELFYNGVWEQPII